MIYYLRYNVEHKNGVSNLKWKVFETEEKFWLTNNVIINTKTWTDDTPFPEGGFKYSLYCDGTMTFCDENKIIIE